MEQILLQIESALQNKEYLIALFCTLALPDICGALEKSNGKATKSRYVSWYDNNMIDQRCLTANQCYNFRCRMLHQGISGYNQNSLNQKIVFIYPNSQITMDNNRFTNGEKEIINIDLKIFCEAMIASVRKWEIKMQSNPIFIKNKANLITIHPNGIPPFATGFPFIG